MKINKKLSAFLLLCIFPKIHALSGEIKVRGGAFFPTSQLFKCIYGKAAGLVEIEGAISLCDRAQLWANFDWFSKSGRSLGFCNPTTIHVPSLSVGVKVPFDICDWFTFYFGAGPNFAWPRINNASICGCECASKGGVGVVLKSGMDFNFRCAFVDVFVDYVNQSIKFEQRATLSGLRVGAGVGTRF